MRYDKGPQITVGELKHYLACIPDDVKVCISIGDTIEELHYLENLNGKLLLLPDCYMQNAAEMNLYTMRSLMKDEGLQDE